MLDANLEPTLMQRITRIVGNLAYLLGRTIYRLVGGTTFGEIIFMFIQGFRGD
jgi:hypothetical protein